MEITSIVNADLFELNVLTYNIFIPVLKPIRDYGQFERAERVAEVIIKCQEITGKDVDIVILNEVIPVPIDTIVSDGMAGIGFVHRTDPFKDLLAERGGIIVFSKYPIVQSKYTMYGENCSGSDCLSSKGIVYARVKKNNEYVNIFATHMQAWSSVKEQFVRHGQIKQIQKFIKSVSIPKSEPVFLAGDLNMDLFHERSHLNHLMYSLGLEIPAISEDSAIFTFDAENNQMVGNDEPNSYQNDEYPDGCVEEYYKTKTCPCCTSQWLDYVLTSKNHIEPVEGYMQSIPVKVEPFDMSFNMFENIMSRDVSDHFPVLGSFKFNFKNLQKVDSSTKSHEVILLEDEDIGTNGNTTQTVVFIVLIIIAVVIVLGFSVFFFSKYRKKRNSVTGKGLLKTKKKKSK